MQSQFHSQRLSLVECSEQRERLLNADIAIIKQEIKSYQTTLHSTSQIIWQQRQNNVKITSK